MILQPREVNLWLEVVGLTLAAATLNQTVRGLLIDLQLPKKFCNIMHAAHDHEQPVEVVPLVEGLRCKAFKLWCLCKVNFADLTGYYLCQGLSLQDSGFSREGQDQGAVCASHTYTDKAI